MIQNSVIFFAFIVSALVCYQQIGQRYFLSDRYLQENQWTSKYCGGHQTLGDGFGCYQQCTIHNGLIHHQNKISGQIVKRQFYLHGVHRLWIADSQQRVAEYCIRFQ